MIAHIKLFKHWSQFNISLFVKYWYYFTIDPLQDIPQILKHQMYFTISGYKIMNLITKLSKYWSYFRVILKYWNSSNVGLIEWNYSNIDPTSRYSSNIEILHVFQIFLSHSWNYCKVVPLRIFLKYWNHIYFLNVDHIHEIIQTFDIISGYP